MFFFGGVHPTQEFLGIVADYCPMCREVRKHTLTEVRQRYHAYFIFGVSRKLGCTKECVRCGFQSNCNEHKYDEILDEEDGHHMSTAGVLKYTNSALKEELDCRT